MEIRIDTDKDSTDQIKKVIKFLQSLVGEEPSGNESSFVDIFSTSSSTDSNNEENGMFDIFSNDTDASVINIEDSSIDDVKKTKKDLDDEYDDDEKDSYNKSEIKIIPY